METTGLYPSFLVMPTSDTHYGYFRRNACASSNVRINNSNYNLVRISNIKGVRSNYG